MNHNTRHSRQSFLGSDAEEIIGSVRAGIVGLGGGGSHIVQHLAHIGFRDFVLYDPDSVEESNLNRLIGATMADAQEQRAKVDVAQRLVEGLQSEASISRKRSRWQDDPGALRSCDVIFGCLDTLQDRSELEVCARRFLIPYVDIGLGVLTVAGERPRMGGQVVLSVPGSACFRCFGFLNERDLAEEVGRYGHAGPRPQVVWANAVLAATAVGIAVDLLTDWTSALRGPVYLSYDGNTGLIAPHPRLRYAAPTCTHFPPDEIGEPAYISV
jgi:molybdopterin-synthase adenylyltransferase